MFLDVLVYVYMHITTTFYYRGDKGINKPSMTLKRYDVKVLSEGKQVNDFRKKPWFSKALHGCRVPKVVEDPTGWHWSNILSGSTSENL